jgi:hypothetical protein
MTKEELIKDYETWAWQMQVYPHYKAWMDAEVAMYEMEFGEGQAFQHAWFYRVFSHDARVQDYARC